MVIQFYHNDISPPSRSVLWTLKELGLQYEEKAVNLFQAEHKKPEYLAINPRGKVPALVDGDLKLSESRAIATYLCNQYAKEEKQYLYPIDPDVRAVVDMHLYISEWVFDQAMAYMNFGGILFRGENVKNEKLEGAKDALKLMDKTLEGRKYLTGDNVTLADFFGYPSVLFLEAVGFNDFSGYSNLEQWMKLMKKHRFCAEVNDKGMAESVGAVNAKLQPKK